jgi:CDP-glycerol glycerophosphotransferase (TagB/SpsB family)
MISFQKRVYAVIIFTMSLFSRILFFGKKYKKTVIVTDFPHENRYSFYRIAGKDENIVYFAKSKNDRILNDKEYHPIKSESIMFLIKIIPYLTKSDLVICDNYFPFLSSYIKPKKQSLIQIWHADGAVKNFGIKSSSIDKKTKYEIRVYRKVYTRFDRYICSSQQMANAFINNYDINPEKIEIIGSPNIEHMKKSKESIHNRITNENPFLNGAKIILYAPTFKNYEYNYQGIVEGLYKYFSDEYVIIVKYHPKNMNKYRENFLNYRTDELMSVADVLITDYSSMFFKFININPDGKTFLLWDDFSQYEKNNSINSDFMFNKKDLISRSVYEIKHKIDQNKISNRTILNQYEVHSREATAKLVKIVYSEN